MDTKKYALKVKQGMNDIYNEGYYTGKNYIYQGSRYAVADRDINKAKIYFSKARANKACEMEFQNYMFEVEEIN